MKSNKTGLATPLIITAIGAVLLVLNNFSMQTNSEPGFLGDRGKARTEQLAKTEPPPVILPEAPEEKVLSGGSHTFQTFNNCGPASLSMALSYHGINVNQQELGKEIRPFQNPQGNNDDKSVTLQELAAKGEEYGLVPYHRAAGDNEMLKDLIAAELPVITRTWLNLNEDIGHYRVVKGYRANGEILVQDDSLQGRNLEFAYVEYAKLWQAFNYEFLVLVPQDKKETVEAILGGKLEPSVAWEAALELSRQQLEQNPTDIYPRFNQVVALYNLGRFEEATAVFEAVENQLPSRMLWYQIEPILAYYHLENYNRAMQLSSRILNNNNRAFSELHYLQGLIYQNQGQNVDAEAAFSRAEQYNQGKYWRANLSGIE